MTTNPTMQSQETFDVKHRLALALLGGLTPQTTQGFQHADTQGFTGKIQILENSPKCISVIIDIDPMIATNGD